MLQNTSLIKWGEKINAIDEVQIIVARGQIREQMNQKW